MFENLADVKDLIGLEKSLILEDPWRLVENSYLTIKTTDGPLTKLALKPAQAKLNNFIKDIISHGIPPRIWVVKARQEGFTTDVMGLIYALTTQKEGINSCIIADDDKGANYILEMGKLYHEFLYKEKPHLVPEKKRSNAKELVFKDIHSQILIDTARNVNAGRKYTFQYVLFSEIAYYEHPDILLTGFQSVPNHPNTLIVGESTANGIGNFFYTEVMKAKMNQSTWQLFFSSWLEEPNYRKRMDGHFIKHFESTITPEEEALIEKHGADREQLWWRRWCIIQNCYGINLSGDQRLFQPDEYDAFSMNKFHQEYPSTLEEAFVSSGRGIFDNRKLQLMLVDAPKLIQVDRYGVPTEELIPGKNYAQGYFTELDNKVRFVFDPHGPWQIFEWPQNDLEYVNGTDVSEGIEIEEGTQKYDYTVMKFRRRDNLNEVACYRNIIDTDLIAPQVRAGCIAYNWCMACVERNGLGLAVINDLKKIYPHIFMSEVEDERTQRKTRKLGWHTAPYTTRPIMIKDYAKAIRTGELKIRSTNGTMEAMSFIRHRDGKEAAQTGCHDDEVMADAMCLQMNIRLPHAVDYTQELRLVKR